MLPVFPLSPNNDAVHFVYRVYCSVHNIYDTANDLKITLMEYRARSSDYLLFDKTERRKKVDIKKKSRNKQLGNFRLYCYLD